MKRRAMRHVAAALTVLMLFMVVQRPTQAQAYDYLVYDDANWYEALLQFIQMIEQFRLMLRQAQRLPVNMLDRYHGHSVDWLLHDLTGGLQYAQGILNALNAGDPSGAAYKQIVAPLDVPTDVVSRMPANLQRRLTTTYAGIELADNVSQFVVNQLGATRVEAPHNLQVAKSMEQDAGSPSDDFQTQTAILNKINAATVLGLRMQDQMNASLVSTLEQLLVANRRQRDAEAVLMNATIYQWRFGQAYGDDLFRNTAAALDGWRQH